jgi:hypothetical protein
MSRGLWYLPWDQIAEDDSIDSNVQFGVPFRQMILDQVGDSFEERFQIQSRISPKYFLIGTAEYLREEEIEW